MTTGDASAVFLDTNTLVYATVAESPFHLPALTAVQSLEQISTTLWVSRQILREYLSTLSRSQT